MPVKGLDWRWNVRCNWKKFLLALALAKQGLPTYPPPNSDDQNAQLQLDDD